MCGGRVILRETAKVRSAQALAGSAGRIGVWASTLCVAICGSLVIALGPIYWSGFSEFAHFGDALIGQVMSAEYFGATVGTVAGILYMHRAATDLRKVVYVALGIYVLGNLLTPYLLGSPDLLRAARFICGLSTGTTFLAAATAVTGVKDATRLIPILYGTPYLIGFVLQPVLPDIFATWGFAASFRLIAAAAAGTIALCPFFPKHPGAGEATEVFAGSGKGSLIGLILICLALLFQYVANSGVWLFFDRIGVVSGHSDQASANFVGLGTGMALVGTALSTVLARRLHRFNLILIATGLMVLSTFMLHFSARLAIFAAAVLSFNVLITFVTSFYFLLLDEAFRSARAVAAGNIALMLGFSLGPLLIGYTAHDATFSALINATIGVFALSAIALVAFAVVCRSSVR
jgi:predicted MFS family arabinose efflux permease